MRAWTDVVALRAAMLFAVAIALSLPAGQTAAQSQPAQPPPAVSAPAHGGRIEALIRDGWEVAGFIAASDIRTLVLFRHSSNPWLVQCSVLIDVTRQPRQIVSCYELR